jgi:hypothetical protein
MNSLFRNAEPLETVFTQAKVLLSTLMNTDLRYCPYLPVSGAADKLDFMYQSKDDVSVFN